MEYHRMRVDECRLCSLEISRNVSSVGNVFLQSNGYQFTNLEAIADADQMFTVLSALCCYFATLKLLRLSRLNARLTLFNRALANAAINLFGFTLMFSIVVFAFITLFYLLFSSKILSCATVLLTTKMLFEMFLLKFDTSDIQMADAFLGPFTFALFIFFLVFIGCTMFISLIIDGLRVALREEQSPTDNDEELLDLFFSTVKR